MGNSVELIKKYLQPIYVETGCSAGDGILKASEAGAELLFGIEPNTEVHFTCLKKTKHLNFHHFDGTSERHINTVVLEIDKKNERAIFFLDAHKVGCCKGETYPLKYELAAIRKARRKDHIVMIDDVRLFGMELPDTKEEVEERLRKINVGYKIVCENSDTNEKDILVAYL
ncbi:MAG: hypothetical protein IMZ70_08020 [Candidatus Atribacteria bacterium]|nr:hypothetical protein [Candidatus Atribacteria bacterium]MBE3122189.1 hypothetical protein [Thermoplasmata archaeon]MBE3139217.1 hypothetical protein [Thermoplasmata archaeon]